MKTISRTVSQRDSVSYTLDLFPFLKCQDGERTFGDYRTKRDILVICNALADAMQTGKAYQKRLDPPPADARYCPPPRSAEPKVTARPDRK